MATTPRTDENPTPSQPTPPQPGQPSPSHPSGAPTPDQAPTQNPPPRR